MSNQNNTDNNKNKKTYNTRSKSKLQIITEENKPNKSTKRKLMSSSDDSDSSADESVSSNDLSSVSSDADASDSINIIEKQLSGNKLHCQKCCSYCNNEETPDNEETPEHTPEHTPENIDKLSKSANDSDNPRKKERKIKKIKINLNELLNIMDPLKSIVFGDMPEPEDPLASLSTVDKLKLKQVEHDLFELNKFDLPPREKILLTDMSLGSKNKIINSMNRLENMNGCGSEYSKLKQWLDAVLSIPFGIYNNIPINLLSSNDEISDYLGNIQDTMENCIYGQDTAKHSILECIAKWITNPNSANRPISFVGEKGTGKTTLAKHGIAKALNRPFFTISLGGESDSASFKGHDYTYEGARWGKIMECIIQAKCMNPVFLFDELDKVSDTKIGDEIIGMLMHLTDMTQNDKYTDKYFCGIDIDMSRCLFIFSYNDSNKVNHILKDRLTEIQFTSFNRKEKLNILKKFTISATCQKIGIQKENYEISDKTLEYIINKYDPSNGGIRELEKIIELLFMRINLLQLPNKLNLNYGQVLIKKTDNKFNISVDVVNKLLYDIQNNTLPSCAQSMYM